MTTSPELPVPPKATMYLKQDHPISRRNIDQDALRIIHRLTDSGFKAYLVGGGVRDLFLKKTPKDFDIATDATPKEIKSLFRNSRIIGKRYKLVHIFFHGGKNIEVCTFRDTDVPIDPNEVASSDAPIITRENTFGTETSDALRRDLTINGLFYDARSFSIIDYVGGVSDLKAGIIRIIGDPDVRLSEDPVRMLRVARHAARNNFTVEPATRASVLKNFHLIARASPVRVYDEIKKDLSHGSILPTLRLMHDLRLLEALIPALANKNAMLLSDISECARCLGRVDELKLKGIESSATVVLALIVLFARGLVSDKRDIYTWLSSKDDIEEACTQTFKYLSVPRKERERITGLLASWLELGPPPFSRAKVQGLRRHWGREDLPTFINVLSDETDAEFVEKNLPSSAPPVRQRGGGHGGPGPRRSSAPRSRDAGSPHGRESGK